MAATPVTSAIDRLFDQFDGSIAAVSRLFDRLESSMRLVRGPAGPAQISEMLDAQTGTPIFVVTFGGTRVECRTKEAAERVRRGLEAVA